MKAGWLVSSSQTGLLSPELPEMSYGRNRTESIHVRFMSIPIFLVRPGLFQGCLPNFTML